MKMNIFLKGAALSIAAVAALAVSAEPYDYTTKAINAYDHNGKLINSHIAPDVQYIEVEDYKIEPEVFSITGADGNTAKFIMIPVIGTNKYTLKSSLIKWPTAEKSSVIPTYYIGQTEVTNAVWKAVMGTVPSKNSKEDNFPVECVSWNDICKSGGFLDRLNEKIRENPEMEKLLQGREFCLPTEWEWEYAAGGGNLMDNYAYSGSNNINDVAWYKDNSDNTTHEVATKLPNGLGIYDMSGNVWEWCSENYYRNYDGTIDKTISVNRGCGYGSELSYMSYGTRGGGNPPATPNQNIGLRLVLKKKTVCPETFTLTGSDGAIVSFNMIPVNGTSSYRLKANTIEWPEEDRYSVVNSFWIGETEVTNALWKAVMGTVPSQNNSGDNYPVESVSWNDICKSGGFLDKLNEKAQADPAMNELMKGRKFCLPTEWEWEYAAGGGNRMGNYKYSGSNNLGDVAWYKDNSNNTTHEVASKQPNDLGLYDMSGNVWEWCAENRFRNGDGTYNNSNRPNRGCAFGSNASYMGYTTRGSGNNANNPNPNIGLRLILK